MCMIAQAPDSAWMTDTATTNDEITAPSGLASNHGQDDVFSTDSQDGLYIPILGSANLALDPGRMAGSAFRTSVWCELLDEDKIRLVLGEDTIKNRTLELPILKRFEQKVKSSSRHSYASIKSSLETALANASKLASSGLDLEAARTVIINSMTEEGYPQSKINVLMINDTEDTRKRLLHHKVGQRAPEALNAFRQEAEDQDSGTAPSDDWKSALHGYIDIELAADSPISYFVDPGISAYMTSAEMAARDERDDARAERRRRMIEEELPRVVQTDTRKPDRKSRLPTGFRPVVTSSNVESSDQDQINLS